MLWCHFLFFSCFCFFMHRLTAEVTCQPGEKATLSRDKCFPCPKNQYRPKSGKYVECLNCDPCEFYSKKIAACTPTNNTKCQCMKGFTPLDDSEQRCTCSEDARIISRGDEFICEKNPIAQDSNRTEHQPCKGCTQKGETVPITDVNSKNRANEKAVKEVNITSSTSTEAPHTSDVIHLSSTSRPTDRLGPLAVILILLLFQCAIVKLKFKCCYGKMKTVARQDSACGKPVEESGKEIHQHSILIQTDSSVHS